MGKYDPAPTVAAGLLRLARVKANLTQADLARRADVSQQLISAYETGRREPSLPTLQRLVAAAGFELRFRLEPLDDHDDSLRRLLDTLPPETRAEVEKEQTERAQRARLDRTRGR
jgi:transcriptional regulator with XRE-family HTH domain